MKKSLFFPIIFLLTFCISLQFTGNSKAEVLSRSDVVTKEEAHQKAYSYIKGISKQIYPTWKDSQVDEGHTLYDLDGNVTGYAFQIEKNNEEHGYIIVNGKKMEIPL
ncbi:hypothetical protein [Bacillus cereus]|uniref:hypothetical protein n=1 Tax=Bacillus cereus TaxID=1396 RepID=UPI001929492F|nr:hypothetical protein [Bacillus cereus]MBL3741173.1 hypothetical protein [Bacillus cereus]MBL3863801.1 hypothetical protein [Bacillus cereus]